jgi:hypothetical protein
MSSFIQSKLLYEYKPAQLIGLGYGSIVHSDADLLVLSAFCRPSFVSNSTIGAVNDYLKATRAISLEEKLKPEFVNEGLQLIDLMDENLNFKKILVLSMGKRELLKMEDKSHLADIVINNLKIGLQRAKAILSKEPLLNTIDVTALGTMYGGVRRKESFDLLINWATDLFDDVSNVSLVRYVAYDLDTFVDFFESIYRLKKFKPENEIGFSISYNLEGLAAFKAEMIAGFKNLDNDPRSVIVSCRSIIESIVKIRIGNPSIRLVEGIDQLKEVIPPSIYNYLTVCRLLGNVSVHDFGFAPTRRDAEGILILTLRVIEWHTIP